MEYCMEARALKSSFLSEAAMKSTQQVFLDDFWCVTGINNVNSDDFSVDDLLDFSDKDFNEVLLEESEEYEEKDCSLSVSCQNKGVVFDYDNNSNSITSTGSGVFESLPASELAVPVDEMENLEWLSQFVDDSASGISLLCPTGNFTVNRSEPEAKKFTVLDLPYPVRTKARGKRSRPSGRIWSLGLLLLTESLSPFLSSSQDSSLTSPFIPLNPVHVMGSSATFQKPPLKKQKRNPAVETGSQSGRSQPLRRCSHCLVQKTPQWRTGPLGPKTLCNACGVRFKSGRLFPEYRPACSPTFAGHIHSNSHRKVLEMPACSPTFAGHIHSNSHRKVLEMRRKKEMAKFVMTGLTQMVKSF